MPAYAGSMPKASSTSSRGKKAVEVRPDAPATPAPAPTRGKPARPSPAAASPHAAGSSHMPPSITTFDEALSYLYDRTDVERLHPSRVDADTFKLDRMHALLELVGDPHHAFRCVHVAGSKGKGSTCEMVAAALEACGYTVGIYTSPHLVDIRERVRINRREIPRDEFVAVCQRVADAAALLPEAMGVPTFFELITAIAFVHFREEAVDVGVIECGLGGRLDSTNVVSPDVTAVTSISRDHWQILGDSLEQIAAEKAGIFKPGIPALSAPQPEGVGEVLRQHAARIGAPFAIVGKDIDLAVRFETAGSLGPHHRVSLATERVSYEHIAVPLRGEHQAANCGLALAILDRLIQRGLACPEAKVTRGLESVALPGRLEVLRTIPRLVLDGAHNRESIRCLIKTLAAQLQFDSTVFIFGCASDKDIPGMLEELALGADKIIFTKTQSARAADPHELARIFHDQYGKMVQAADTLPEAFDIAKRACSRGDILCVAGSLHLVGDVKKYLATRRNTES